MLFQPLFDELLNPLPSVDHPAPKVVAPIDEVAASEPAVSTSSPSSTIVDQDAPSPSNSKTTPDTQPPVIPNDVKKDNHDIKVAHMGNDPYFGIPIPEVITPRVLGSLTSSINSLIWGVEIMPPRKAPRTRTTPATTTNTTSVTNAQLQAMIDKALLPPGSTERYRCDRLQSTFPGTGIVVSSRPKTMQDAIEMATELMDKKISTLAERQAENKRKLDNNNQAQQQSPKRQNVRLKLSPAGLVERRRNTGTLPLCNRCKLHHNGLQEGIQGTTEAGGTGTHGMVLALGGGETDQNPNNVEDEIKA
ncbi:hypothetical protein Tco_1547544 [Tanacetum coccineum]